MKTFLPLLSILLVVFLLSGCIPGTKTPDANMNMVNPASAACGNAKGQSVIRTDSQGGSYGVCVFADKSECDEWAFFRGECKPGDYAVAPTPNPNPHYNNTRYGFRFDNLYNWSASEEGQLVKITNQNYVLTVSFLFNNEAVMPVRPAQIDGELTTGSKLAFLGQELPTHNLVFNDKVRRVVYGGWVNVGQLALVMWLESADSGELPSSVIEEAGKIIESFTLISGEKPTIVIQDIPE